MLKVSMKNHQTKLKNSNNIIKKTHHNLPKPKNKENNVYPKTYLRKINDKSKPHKRNAQPKLNLPSMSTNPSKTKEALNKFNSQPDLNEQNKTADLKFHKRATDLTDIDKDWEMQSISCLIDYFLLMI